MTINNMLRELGYTTSPTGIADFQRHYNRLGTEPVHVSGELDVRTKDAIRLAFEARHVFVALREREVGGA